MDLSGKVAVITGGASGLGGATAEHFVHDKGMRVAIFDIDEMAGQAMAHRLGAGHARFWKVDVADEDVVETAAAEVAAHFGRIDICINAAGIPAVMRIVERDGRPSQGALFRRTLMVNLAGTFHVMSHCAAWMARNEPGRSGERGAVVNIASIAAFEGMIGHGAYAASKAGIVGLALPAAREFARIGVRVNTIAPGLFETPMAGEVRDAVIRSLAAMYEFPQRLGEPAEFVALCVHLCENAYINGECIRIDAAMRIGGNNVPRRAAPRHP